MKTIIETLSERLDFVFDLINEGTDQQTWINKRLVDKESGVTILMSDEECERFFKILY
jgi:hypothetical protein